MRFSQELEFAGIMDSADELHELRNEFHMPGTPGDPITYLCGNSLGLMPKRTTDYVTQELKDWAELGVEGHFQAQRPWLPYHENLSRQTAELLGATPKEVVCMNSLTVNLQLMMVSFYRPDPERFKILMETPAFPSDRYAVESQIRFHGFEPHEALIEVGPRQGEQNIRPENLYQSIEQHGPSIALVLMPGVQYYSGQLFDLGEIVRCGHSHGCFVGFDLAHAVGNVALTMHDWNADFAVWCSYKYLNAGPGAVGGCFIHERHVTNPEVKRFAGWWGHDKQTRFEMSPNFDPIRTAEGWQVSNPSVLSMAPLIASMTLFEQAGMDRLTTKSQTLTGYLEFLIQDRLSDKVQIITPRKPQQRGCQLSLKILSANGKDVFNGLEKERIVCDWRNPDVIRVAPVPLYNTYTDVHRFVDCLFHILSA